MHVMLDLETLGSNPRAPIASIGAVNFDPKGDGFDGEFYAVIDVEEYDRPEFKDKFVPDYSTIRWWLQQSDKARMSTFFPNLIVDETPTVGAALLAFSLFVEKIGPRQEIEVWANGPDFDCVILGYAYDALGWGRKPWSFSKHRCFRTMKNLFPVEKPANVGEHHNALDDAKYQVLWLQEIYKRHFYLPPGGPT